MFNKLFDAGLDCSSFFLQDVLPNFIEQAPQWLLLLKWWGVINSIMLCCSLSFLWTCCKRKSGYTKKKRGHINASSTSSIALDMKINQLLNYKKKRNPSMQSELSMNSILGPLCELASIDKRERRSHKEKKSHDSHDSDSDESKEEKKKSKRRLKKAPKGQEHISSSRHSSHRDAKPPSTKAPKEMGKEEKPFDVYENPDMEADERTKPKEPIPPPPKASSLTPQPKISPKPARKAGSSPKINLKPAAKPATKLQSKPKTAANIKPRAEPRAPDVYDNVDADDEGKSELNRKSAENISKLDEPKDEESHGVKHADKAEKPKDQKQSSQKSNKPKEKKHSESETPDALLQPKRFEKGEKEKVIAQGVEASRHAYKTMDDVDSDWGSPKGDAGVKKPNDEQKQKKADKERKERVDEQEAKGKNKERTDENRRE